jgi:hypothetical protein
MKAVVLERPDGTRYVGGYESMENAKHQRPPSYKIIAVRETSRETFDDTRTSLESEFDCWKTQP